MAGSEFLQFCVGGLLVEIKCEFGGFDAFPGHHHLVRCLGDPQGDLLFEEFQVLFIVPQAQPGGTGIAATLGKRQGNADIHAGGISPIALISHHPAASGERRSESVIAVTAKEVHLWQQLIAGVGGIVTALVDSKPCLLIIRATLVALLQVFGDVQRQVGW